MRTSRVCWIHTCSAYPEREATREPVTGDRPAAARVAETGTMGLDNDARGWIMAGVSGIGESI